MQTLLLIGVLLLLGACSTSSASVELVDREALTHAEMLRTIAEHSDLTLAQVYSLAPTREDARVLYLTITGG